MTSVYRRAEVDCWKCHEVTAVYTWDGHTLWAHALPVGDEPIPQELQLRTTVVPGDRYWANVCSHCGAVQGDWYLYMEPDGPFTGLRG